MSFVHPGVSVIVINLKRSKERRLHMQKILGTMGINFSFFDAVDKQMLTQSIISNECDSKFIQMDNPRRQGEIACAMSHRAVYKYILDNKISEAVILEDDLEIIDSFPKILPGLAAFSKIKKNCIIKLDVPSGIESPCSIWGSYDLDNNYKIVKPNFQVMGTMGYYIDLNACQTLLEKHPKVAYVADEWNVFKKDISLLILKPHLITESKKFSSDIGNSDIKKMETKSSIVKSFLSKSKKRFLYTLKRLLP